jgi:hypothetical protein
MPARFRSLARLAGSTAILGLLVKPISAHFR